ncbi:hypothetical protein PC113_g3264 [Phytophthora cactorum]|uniref:Ubiquitin-like domain-containing protein n=1 Tax=Phytophthora cactorum TaxID=29920 RepID=A0A8T0ZRN2_9STRA|nr:hypothetical protein PC113_g3264 [Phytophthora cactorum]
MMEPEHTENITEEKPLLSEDSVGITINDDNNGMLVLKVKTLSEKPLRVEIAPSASVGELKELVKKKANAEGKFLRLIHQGKMLSDDKATLESCKVKSEDFVHCAISSAPPKAVVNQMAATDSEPEERDDPSTRRGFDRLRDRLSREEIQALRLYFYPQLSVYISQAERVPGESSEDRIYRLEEEWMASQGPQSEFALNVVPTARIAMDAQIDMNGMNNSILAADNEGTGTEFLWGFLMGLLLGVFMLLMLLDRSVPRKQKVGLLLGVSMNFFLNQKAVVKTYVSRDVGDGNIKCFYCATEITSRSLDRWAWHLRGCVKTPDDVKAQIQNS